MVFIRSFSEASFSGAALGWNLMGAVFGGMLETVSQATGLRSLLIIASALYLGSWLVRKRVLVTRGPAMQTSPRSEELALATQ